MEKGGVEDLNGKFGHSYVMLAGNKYSNSLHPKHPKHSDFVLLKWMIFSSFCCHIVHLFLYYVVQQVSKEIIAMHYILRANGVCAVICYHHSLIPSPHINAEDTKYKQSPGQPVITFNKNMNKYIINFTFNCSIPANIWLFVGWGVNIWTKCTEEVILFSARPLS